MAKSDEEKEIDDNKDKDKVKPSDLEEETKLSRLFYLQLYSSVLNAERENERREKLRRRKQLFQDAKKKVVKSLSWMDVSNLLSRSISSTEQDKDIGDIEVNNTHLSRVLSIVEVPAQYFQSVMIDRRMTTSSKGAGGGPRYGAGQAAGSRNPIVYGSNSGYGQHHYIKSPGGPPEYQVYGQSQGYIMGYDRPNSSVASRLQREVETVSASSGSVNDRRRNNRGALEQVVESESTDGSRGEEERSLSRRHERERYRSNSRLERGSVASREVSGRRGSVASQRLETNTRPASRLANTFTRVPDPDRKSSGDETDKDFQFVGGNSDKTIKYDPKNFSFRLKNRDSVVIEEQRGRCSWRQVCCNSLYLGLTVTVTVFVIMLLSTSPQNYRSHRTSSGLH